MITYEWLYVLAGAAFALPAMRRMEADLPRWADAPDWRWCARFSYQVIERRGTGGARHPGR